MNTALKAPLQVLLILLLGMLSLPLSAEEFGVTGALEPGRRRPPVYRYYSGPVYDNPVPRWVEDEIRNHYLLQAARRAPEPIPPEPAGEPTLFSIAVSESTATKLPYAVRLEFNLPVPAAVWINRQPLQMSKEPFGLHSPRLEPGRKYMYAVGMTWQEQGRWVGQSRNIAVEAGHVYRITLAVRPVVQEALLRGR